MLVGEIDLADHALLEEAPFGLGLGDLSMPQRGVEPARVEMAAGVREVRHGPVDGQGHRLRDGDGGQADGQARERAHGRGGGEEERGRAHARQRLQLEREGRRRFGRAEEGHELLGDGDEGGAEGRFAQVVAAARRSSESGIIVGLWWRWGGVQDGDAAPAGDQPARRVAFFDDERGHGAVGDVDDEVHRRAFAHGRA